MTEHDESIGNASRFPTSPQSVQILQERARLFSHQSMTVEGVSEEAFVSMRVGVSEFFGIPYRHLDNITPLVEMTSIPCTPPVIAGVMNYRGALLTLLDPTYLFHTLDTGQDMAKKIVVVVRSGAVQVGLLFDDVVGSGEFNVTDLAPPMGSGAGINVAYIQGIHQGQIVILNTQAILADQDLCVNEGSN